MSFEGIDTTGDMPNYFVTQVHIYTFNADTKQASFN